MGLELVGAAPWTYLALAALAMLPMIPSEAAVISCGVLAAHQDLELGLVIAAALCGGVLGDLASFCLGVLFSRRPPPRRLPNWLRHWLLRFGSWSEIQVTRGNGAMLIAARLIPGGRTAASLTAGLVGVGRSYFCLRIGIGAFIWAALYSTLGYLTGAAVTSSTDALALGVSVALLIVAVTPMCTRLFRAGAN